MEMQHQHQVAISDYFESSTDLRCSPPTARQFEYGSASQPMVPYSPHVLYYQTETAYGLPPPLPQQQQQQQQQPPPPQQQQQQQTDPYYYYYAGHAQRQSPDALSTKLSPPPPPALPMPPPAHLCYPYSPCCCAQLHYQHQHQHQHQPPRCSPDHLLFQQHQQPSIVPEYCQVPVLQAAPMTAPPPPPPPPPPPLVVTTEPRPTPTRQARGGPQSGRRPTSFYQTDPLPSGSWTSRYQQQQQQQLQLQQRRRSGYMHNILYKTELCRDIQDRGACPRGRACQFAHSPSELHDPRRHPLYKTAFCYDFKNKGYCPRGALCFHVHEIVELKDLTPLAPPTHSNGARRGGRGGVGGSGGRHRRSPAAEASKKAAAAPATPQDEPGPSSAVSKRGGGSGRRPATAGGARQETSYRYLMKRLSSASPGSSTGCRPAAATDLASIEAKTLRLCLGSAATPE